MCGANGRRCGEGRGVRESHILGHRRRTELQEDAQSAQFPVHRGPELLKRLRRIVESTKAKVVLSSTWRYDPVGLVAAKHWGIPYIDITPDMPRQPRRKEILAWLKDHPRVDRFAVIDDEDDELDTLPLFQPSSTTGLSIKLANGVRDFLNGNRDTDMRHGSLERFAQDLHSVLKQHQG